MTHTIRVYWLAACYALTIFVSAFLVFQLQPVISKTILPWFGGAPAVWTTCLLFFQVLLFLGYTYAHLITRWVRPTQQGMIHLCLIVTALLLLPVTPSPDWKPADSSYPTLRILLLLAANVGVPYFLLSSTGPLLQAWFARSYAGRSPYRLYALSNVGSLLALLTYPFVVEPALTTHCQGSFWSVGFCGFALICGYLAIRLWQPSHSRHSQAPPKKDPRSDDCETAEPGAWQAPAPRWRDYLWWLVLPAFASMMLLAVTNHVCQDVAVVPFLWIVPLSLYLISFIICFDHEGWYHRFWYGVANLVAILAVSVMTLFAEHQHVLVDTILQFSVLFFICMACHGELVRRKPAPRFLTSYYLMCSAGGAVGGLLVAIVCPLIFSAYWETPMGMIVAYLLAATLLLSQIASRFRRGDIGPADRSDQRHASPSPGAAASGGAALRLSGGTALVAATLFVGLLVVVSLQLRSVHTGTEVSVRNFYGVLHVERSTEDDGLPLRQTLIHGRILHGLQFDAVEKRSLPTTYYAPDSGVGLVMRRHRGPAPRRVGLVGLGVGTLAAYGQSGDYFRFYEINPEVIRLAREHFTFLADTSAAVDIVAGDARLSLEREADQKFDILVLDAFSGDAIPVHLLTREAFTVYQRHLKQDGVLAVNVSNRHLNLVPVLAGLADRGGYGWLQFRSERDARRGASPTHWIILTQNQRLLQDDVLLAAAEPEEGRYAQTLLWTDDYNNLLMVLK